MKFWDECGDNCPSCLHTLLDRQGTGVHPNARCDSRPPWWELPEWQEWLRQATRTPTETPS